METPIVNGFWCWSWYSLFHSAGSNRTQRERERENSYRCVITICISSLRSNSIEFEFLYFFPPKRKYQSRFSGETTGGNGCAHFLSTLGSAVFGSSRPRSLWKRVLDTRHFDEPKPIGWNYRAGLDSFLYWLSFFFSSSFFSKAFHVVGNGLAQ